MNLCLPVFVPEQGPNPLVVCKVPTQEMITYLYDRLNNKKRMITYTGGAVLEASEPLKGVEKNII